jgi:hypothetical protein
MTRTGTAWRRAVPAAFAILVLALAARAEDAPPADSPPPAAPANAAPIQIGRSILVVHEVDGQFGDAPAQHLKINDDIVFSEDITTGADAKAVIEFRDGSTFEIGADAVVRIDSFIFNPEESTSHKAVQVTRGVFRYVSGYVASDQDTKITTPAGEMGIRGSVVEGVVDPSIPDFVYVGEGNATFTNGAGSSDLIGGGSIAVPSSTTPPMAAAAMPAAVAAQAVQAIERHLPPRTSFQDHPLDETWLKQSGTVDLIPVADQRQLQAAAAARPMPAPPARGSLAGELGLLAEGNRVNLFRGGQGPRTPEQTTFLARAAHDNPNAAAIMQRYQLQAQTIHRASMTAGTAFVIRGIGRAGPPADVMQRITAASVRANPGAAAAINRHVIEAYHGPARGGPIHPGANPPIHPQEHNVPHGGTAPLHPQQHVVTPHPPPENHPVHVNPRNPVPHPPGQPGNLGPKLPQQRTVAPPPRGVVPRPPPPQQQRNFGPKPPLAPKQPVKPPPDKKREDQR